MAKDKQSAAAARTTADDAIAEIDRAIAAIGVERDKAEKKAAAFAEAYRQLWSCAALKDDPQARRLMFDVACSRTPAALELHVAALADCVDLKAGGESRRPSSSRTALPTPPLLRLFEPTARFFDDESPRRTFLAL